MSYTEEDPPDATPRMAQTVLCPGYIAKGEESGHGERHDGDDRIRTYQVRLDGSPQRSVERHLRLAVVPYGGGLSTTTPKPKPNWER